MTAQQLYDLTVGMMGITPSNATSYNDTIIPQMNTILAQTFTLENTVRAYKGLTELTTIPTVSALTDTLTYQDSVLKNVVLWGLARLLALSDDETIKASFYGQQFADGYNSENKLIASEIVDYFGEDDETTV